MPTPGRTQTASPALVWLAILILYVVWGSTYLGIRIAIESIPPFVMASTRFFIAGVVMLAAVVIVRRRSLVLPSPVEVRDSFIVGALLMGGGMGAVAWGEQTVPSGIAALLIAMMPVWVAIYGRAFFHDRLPLATGLGIGVGMAGVAILVAPSIILEGEGSLDPAGVLALLISPMSWAAGSVFAARRARLPHDPFMATSLQMLTGALVLGLLGVAVGEFARFDPAAVTSESLAALAYLTIAGSLVAFTAYAWVLRHAPLPLIATYAFVNPVVAVILGAVILNETVTSLQVLAGSVIVIGVALIIWSRARMASPETEARPVGATARDESEIQPTAA